MYRLLTLFGHWDLLSAYWEEVFKNGSFWKSHDLEGTVGTVNAVF